MRSGNDILSQLERIEPEPLNGTYYRIVRIEFMREPLGTLGSKRAGGRYNLKGKFEVLYLAADSDLALKESSPGFEVKFPPHVLFSVEVNLSRVVRLDHPKIREELGVSLDDLLIPWRYDQNVLGQEAFTQKLGRMIRSSKRFEAILYPSKVDPSRSNLGILMDRIRKGSTVDLYDPDKIVQWTYRGQI
ncbi:MAG: RES family NAD+ phosphorylase [Candidatus Manganitrophaceae bacterium]